MVSVYSRVIIWSSVNHLFQMISLYSMKLLAIFLRVLMEIDMLCYQCLSFHFDSFKSNPSWVRKINPHHCHSAYLLALVYFFHFATFIKYIQFPFSFNIKKKKILFFFFCRIINKKKLNPSLKKMIYLFAFVFIHLI